MTIVIERILDRNSPLPGDMEKDVVVLDWEARRKSRQRITTGRGREIAIALPTGTILEDGDVLFAGDSFYVAVEAKEEDLMVISPKNINESARIAFELGNRHLPVSIRENTILTLYSHDTESVMESLGAAYERRKGIFEPVRRTGHHVHG
jgi:urease accessory protein